jgi:5-methylcytosine-specific restriction endonuclease McrA
MDAYSTDQWRRIRRAYLRTHPTCVDCGDRATEPDHVPPRALLLALGIHNPDDEQWLNPRCKRCHSTKTKLVDQPLLRRWRNGEDAQSLAEEAMTTQGRGRPPSG